MLLALRCLLRPLRALADASRLVAAARAVERARLVHELRLRALYYRLSCVGLAPCQQRENRFLARELDRLADRFTAPSSADKLPKPAHAETARGTVAGRIAYPTAARGCRDSGASAQVALAEAAPREDERRSDPGAAHHVTH